MVLNGKRDYDSRRSSSTSSVSAAPPPAPPCPTFKSAALNRVHVNQVRRYEEVKTGYEYEYKEDPAAQKNRRMAFQAGKSAEKHQKCGMKSWNRSWEKGGNQNRNHHGRPGEQKQQWQASVCKGADSDNNFSTGESGQGKRAAADCGLQSARDGRDPAREARHVRHESNTNTQEQRFVSQGQHIIRSVSIADPARFARRKPPTRSSQPSLNPHFSPPDEQGTNHEASKTE